MFDWLTATPAADADAGTLVARLAVAALFGAAVAAVYYGTQRKTRAEAAPFVATLVLLTILLAMVTGVIGDSVARAFGLVGALSIVRFRTVVDDTRDTAFVIFAVVTGMAVGTGMVALAAAALPVVASAAWLLSRWAPVPPAGRATLTVRVGLGADPDALLAPFLEQHFEDIRLLSAVTARQGVALELTYAARARPGVSPAALVAGLNTTAGVQAAEWRHAGD